MNNLANWLTASRFPLTIAMLVAFYSGTSASYSLTLVLFIVAIISDVLDGYLARRLKQVSDLGTWLDPLLDKVMIYSMIFSLFHVGIFSPLLVFAMFFRDMLADGLRSHVHAVAGPVRSNVWGKAKFSFQAAAVCAGLLYCVDVGFPELKWCCDILLGFGFALSLFGLLDIVRSMPRGYQSLTQYSLPQSLD